MSHGDTFLFLGHFCRTYKLQECVFFLIFRDISIYIVAGHDVADQSMDVLSHQE